MQQRRTQQVHIRICMYIYTHIWAYRAYDLGQDLDRCAGNQEHVKTPPGGELHPHNQAEVLEVPRGPSNLRWFIEKFVALFF